MVIPSRWLAGGRGLDEFRKNMLSSHNLMKLVDFPISKEVFPNVSVEGGICYFLWSKAHNRRCDVTVVRGDNETTSVEGGICYFLWSKAHNRRCDVTVVRGDNETTSSRQLDEFDIFVRDPRAVDILRKVLKAGEPPITEILTADTPFGIATNFDGFRQRKRDGDVTLHYVRSGKRDVGYVSRSIISKNEGLVDKWKVLVPEARGGGQDVPNLVLGKPWVSAPPSVSTQTFLAFFVDSESEAESSNHITVQSFFDTSFLCENLRSTLFDQHIHGFLSNHGTGGGRMNSSIRSTSSPRKKSITLKR